MFLLLSDSQLLDSFLLDSHIGYRVLVLVSMVAHKAPAQYKAVNIKVNRNVVLVSMVAHTVVVYGSTFVSCIIRLC